MEAEPIHFGEENTYLELVHRHVAEPFYLARQQLHESLLPDELETDSWVGKLLTEADTISFDNQTAQFFKVVESVRIVGGKRMYVQQTCELGEVQNLTNQANHILQSLRVESVEDAC